MAGGGGSLGSPSSVGGARPSAACKEGFEDSSCHRPAYLWVLRLQQKAVRPHRYILLGAALTTHPLIELKTPSSLSLASPFIPLDGGCGETGSDAEQRSARGSSWVRQGPLIQTQAGRPALLTDCLLQLRVPAGPLSHQPLLKGALTW